MGDGRDTIENTNWQDQKFDTLVLHGVTPGQVSVVRSADNFDTLELHIDGSTSQAIVLNNQTARNFADHIDRVVFDDGTVWTASDLVIQAMGGYGPVTIQGTDASETIFGTEGNDVIDGGAGDDLIESSSGIDLILYGAGSGNDELDDFFGGPYWQDADTVRLVELNPDDVVIGRTRSDLMITVVATGETLTVSDQFDPPGFPFFGELGIERVEFADGSVLTRDQIFQDAIYRGTAGNDFINGSSANETFQGLGGDDFINGSGGSDTYRRSPGDGNDTISDVSEYPGGYLYPAAFRRRSVGRRTELE